MARERPWHDDVRKLAADGWTPTATKRYLREEKGVEVTEHHIAAILGVVNPRAAALAKAIPEKALSAPKTEVDFVYEVTKDFHALDDLRLDVNKEAKRLRQDPDKKGVWIKLKQLEMQAISKKLDVAIDVATAHRQRQEESTRFADPAKMQTKALEEVLAIIDLYPDFWPRLQKAVADRIPCIEFETEPSPISHSLSTAGAEASKEPPQ